MQVPEGTEAEAPLTATTRPAPVDRVVGAKRKRAPTAFVLWRKTLSQTGPVAQRMKEASTKWKALTPSEKEVWQAK